MTVHYFGQRIAYHARQLWKTDKVLGGSFWAAVLGHINTSKGPSQCPHCQMTCQTGLDRTSLVYHFLRASSGKLMRPKPIGRRTGSDGSG